MKKEKVEKGTKKKDDDAPKRPAGAFVMEEFKKSFNLEFRDVKSEPAGGIGVKRSIDELAASCLSYDLSEPPRLVHRLDRDCSGWNGEKWRSLSATEKAPYVEKASKRKAIGTVIEPYVLIGEIQCPIKCPMAIEHVIERYVLIGEIISVFL